MRTYSSLWSHKVAQGHTVRLMVLSTTESSVHDVRGPAMQIKVVQLTEEAPRSIQEKGSVRVFRAFRRSIQLDQKIHVFQKVDKDNVSKSA